MKLRPHKSSKFITFLGWLLTIFRIQPNFFTNTWITWGEVVYYPSCIKSPWGTRFSYIRLHEIIHTYQFRYWGKATMVVLHLFFPLPILLSGRWFIERHAFLQDIKSGVRTLEESVDDLWRFYLIPWPKPLMRRWFKMQLEKENQCATN